MPIEAKPGGCEEAAIGMPGYIPCNKPATKMIGWPGREGPYRMCDGCAHRNTRNRGATDMGPFDPKKARA